MVALSRAVGRKAAMEMLLTGDLVDAARARELGLVNRVVPEAGLDAAVAALAGQIAGKSPLTLAIGKAAFYRQAEMPLDAGLCLRVRGDGAEHAGARRGGGDRRVPGTSAPRSGPAREVGRQLVGRRFPPLSYPDH